MNSEIEICPSCETNLYSHSNQQVSECIKKQISQFKKQEEKTLAGHSSKDPTKGTSQGTGGATIA